MRPIAHQEIYRDPALLHDPLRAGAELARPLLPQFDRPDLLAGDTPGNLAGYLPGDSLGASGIERACEEALRGARGARLMHLSGEEVRENRKDPVPGQTVRLTLDIDMQAEIHKAVLDPARQLRRGQDGQDHNVGLIVMGLDGQLPVALSTPSFDLNQYDRQKLDLNRDEANLPLMNRAISAAYPPGSTVKPFVALAALTERLVSPTDTIVCQGRLNPRDHLHFACNSIHGPVQLVTAIEASCNVYFYTMGSRLGIHPLARWYRDFGFGAVTGLGLREEENGRLVDPDKDPRLAEPDVAKATATMMGIGQGPIAVTPLQMAQAYATLLRGGVIIRPRLLLDGSPVTLPAHVNVPPEHLRTIRDGMELVVSGSRGTARHVLNLHLPVAGKTGSAEAHRTVTGPDGRPTSEPGTIAWFAGYAPADKPQYVIVSVMEFGGHGGVAATPLVKETILALERHHYLPPLDIP